MKKTAFLLAALFCIFIIACNNSDDNKKEEVSNMQKAKADSLEKEVMEGHDAAMPKSTKIPKLRQEAKRLIDSIARLPAKAQEAA
ncbi:MAG TPA: hypothetical protein VI461_13940, partial [Chitinophagaceae bacterium]|nr:hypothetical protein [Chitinophagaceae bacterium]